MKTAVISDLHLGGSANGDLLRRPAIRALLLEATADCSRLILLGDTIELRDRPLAEALEQSSPFFDGLGKHFDEIVMIPGNHDHRLLGNWIERHLDDPAPTVELDAIVTDPHRAISKIADWVAPANLELRYPGFWVRDDVFATHGHYLDSHLTLPTVERLSVAAVDRLSGRPTSQRDTPDDYEMRHAPVYDLLFNLAQGARGDVADSNGQSVSMRLWDLVGGASGTARTIRGRLLGNTVIPAAIGLMERVGLGQFNRDFSLGEIGRAGVDAMHQVVESLSIEADHVIFGHIHRRGPLPGEDGSSGAHPNWKRGRTRLHNTGSWLYVPIMLAAANPSNPFWPGRVIVVGESGPPEAIDLLDETDRASFVALGAFKSPSALVQRPGGRPTGDYTAQGSRKNKRGDLGGRERAEW